LQPVSEDRDAFVAFYTEHLWGLLPEVYRTSDSDDPARSGALRELVERIGAQIAVVRRHVDRTRDDQFIETCDDWVIPYLGDLLATNLVSGLDARARRLDVANTIYYRRRKGTVGLIEELAAHVTNWNARVVEFFRRLARTRHALDPAIGDDREAAVTHGLRGALSGSPSGGFADLRHVGAARSTSTAFDEFGHVADLRRGRLASGWHNIPKLGVFLWRLRSLAEKNSTPVEDSACPGQFTFDPTGRELPLFVRDARDRAAYGDAWVTPDEWMLPGRLTGELLTREAARLYPESLAVVDVTTAGETLLPMTGLQVSPERGRYRVPAAPAPGASRRVRYHRGFASTIGAGAYARQRLGRPLDAAAIVGTISDGGNSLQTALTALTTGRAAFTIADSLTYPAVADVGGVVDLRIAAGQAERPVARLNGGEWALTGVAGARLTLDGLLISGADVVLRGTFQTVTLAALTLDPGEDVLTDGTTPQSVDGRPLRASTLWIEGAVEQLHIDRSIVGPIRIRGGGAVAAVHVRDSIVQSVRTAPATAPPAIDCGSGMVDLERVTVLGQIGARHISASESILLGVAVAEDAQEGCVRFSTYTAGSVLHQPYESVTVPEGAGIFASTRFGQPDFAQLSLLADREVLGEGSIREGAQNGGEMGAFWREAYALKERGLRAKLDEFMPIGLTPVFVFVT
jgi:hypothetical protein